MSGFAFGTPQTNASTAFAFGASAATPQASALQPAPAFGSPSLGTAAVVPQMNPAPATTATSGISFGLSAPPYGAQTTTAAPASAFSFGLGTSVAAAAPTASTLVPAPISLPAAPIATR